jgi:uncharacterized protein YbjT (DUF2867 family)
LKEPAGTFKVRALTRNTSSPAAQTLAARGVEVVQADLASLEQTAAAFAGAWGVFGLTQFYEHGFDAEQVHGKNIVQAAKAAGVQHLVWSTVEGREGECAAISWRSKALIEQEIEAAGIPCTYFHVPMYYQVRRVPIAIPTGMLSHARRTSGRRSSRLRTMKRRASTGACRSYPTCQSLRLASKIAEASSCPRSRTLRSTLVSDVYRHHPAD